jgi:alpha-N-arabinofuranosidase
MISTHFIRTTNQVALPNPFPEFMAEAAYALPFAVGRDFEQMQNQVNAIPAMRNKVHFALTEWLFNSRGKGERVFTNDSPNSNNQGGALMAAGMFNTIIRTSPDISLADMTGLMEFAGIWKQKEQVYGTPAYYTFRLYTSVSGDTILPVTTDSGRYDVRGAVQSYETMQGIPYIDVVATLSPDRRSMTIFCINRDVTADTSVRFDLRWFHADGRAEVETMSAANRYAQNDGTDPRHVVPDTSSFPIPGSGAISYTLPHESVVRLRIQRSGN